MAKNMTERKKNAGRNQITELKATPSPSPEKSSSDKGVKANAGRNQVTELKATPNPEKSSSDKSTKTAERSERREAVKQDSRSAAPRRDSKGSSTLALRMRNNTLGRFIYDAYYELRHKVTWPTLREARNMTIVVIALSVVIGGILAAADFGLHQLFLLIIGAK